MKVFVAGATGVLGRRAVRELVAAGHEVTGVARTPEKASLLRSLGATPVTVDLFDADAVRSVVAGHDVVCNLATHIPGLSRAASTGAWEENDRVRVEASRNLVDGALATGAHRYIQESIAFQYADGGDRWLDETSPPASADVLASVRSAEAEAARFAAAGGGRVAVVLRFAMFYGFDASSTRVQLRSAANGIAPVLGDADGYQTMLHLDDAGRAVVAALNAPGGTYNIAEDRPCTRREQADAMAAALGMPPLWMPPPRLGGGIGPSGSLISSSQRITAGRFREAAAWAPEYPDATSGWRQVVAESGLAPTRSAVERDDSRRLLVRVLLVVLAAPAALIGGWATFAPRSWFRSFPGFGRHWVAIDGPYNHHLVSDVGALFLALALVTVAAVGSRSRMLVRVAGSAWIISALPHFLYHLTHRAGASTGDFVASVGGLALQVVLGVICVIAAPPARVVGASSGVARDAQRVSAPATS